MVAMRDKLAKRYKLRVVGFVKDVSKKSKIMNNLPISAMSIVIGDRRARYGARWLPSRPSKAITELNSLRCFDACGFESFAVVQRQFNARRGEKQLDATRRQQQRFQCLSAII